MLMPPKQPTSPATTPTTGAMLRRSSTAEQISATAFSPRLASCSRTPPVSRSSTAAVTRPLRVSRAANRNAWLILAPDTSPVPPPWKPCSMDGDDDGAAVDGPAGDDDAVVGLRHDALRYQPGGLDPVERSAEHVDAVGVEQACGRG